MTSQALPLDRTAWLLRYAARLRLLRIGVLGAGLVLGLFLAVFTTRDLLDEPFVLGASLFAVATGLTWTPGFKNFHPWVMTAVPILDLATIAMFDLIPRAEAVDALVALPAMWLGLVLGRRGIAVAALATGAFAVVPGLVTHGVPTEGWVQALSSLLFAGLAAAGLAVSAEVWAKQVGRLKLQGQALEDAVSVKVDFIALVSHELRTPLTSIIGYLDLIKDVEEPMPEEAVPYLAAMDRNADRLLLLVTDLLAASEVENAPMRLAMESVDVSTLATMSLDDIAPRAREAGLVLVADLRPGLVIQADPSRLLQVFDNLLSNALKFTPPGGRIFVSLCRSESGVDMVVTDTGVGIDVASLPHVGTKFFRTPQTRDAAIPGVGLGLMISKAIIEAHHGELTLTSGPGPGTSVCVHLPSGTPGWWSAAQRVPQDVTRSH